MVEHLNNAIMLSINMQFMLDEEKFQFLTLDIVPKRPDTMADMVIAKCVRNRWLNAFPILILFGAHILSLYE